MGFSPEQINSENPIVLEDASQKRLIAIKTIDEINETTLSFVPLGGITYKAFRGTEITWAAAGIILVGKIGKGAGGLVKIIAKDKDVIYFSAKKGSDIIEALSHYRVEDGKLFLDKLHLQESRKFKFILRW